MAPVVAVVAAIVATIGVTATVIIGSAILIGATLGLSALLAPKKKTDAALGALSQTLDPEAYGVIVLGNAPCGNDEIFWEVYGSNHDSYDQVIAAAGHKITSFQDFYVNGLQVTFGTPPSSGGATGTAAQGTYGNPNYIASAGTYSGGVLTKANMLCGTSGSTFPGATGSGSLWTSASSFTGRAAYRLKWKYSQSNLPGGIPARTVQVVEGSPVYDPRKDSTQGGSGSHRATDCTTWTYSDLDTNSVPIGRNNALQMLRYILGWKIANTQTGQLVLVDGRGVNPNDLNYANWIAQANICETEGYYTDCTLSTSDDHNTNEGIIAAGAGAVLLDTGGLWSYHVAHDDTASIAVALNDDNIISNISWIPKSSISDLYNQFYGTFIDPSVPSLYQAAQYPPVQSSTFLAQDGGISKGQELDFQNVQSPTLAQKLAWIALNRNRLTGIFKATFNFSALQANNYDCVTLSFTPFGWVNKLFRVTSLGIDPSGGVNLTLQEEASSVYAAGAIQGYTSQQQGITYNINEQIAVSGLTASPISVAGSGGTAVDGLHVSWTLPSGTAQYVEVYYKKHTDTNWTPFGSVTFDQTSVDISPLQPLTSYDVQVRIISVAGVPGGYACYTQTTGNYTLLNTSASIAAGITGQSPLAAGNSLTPTQVANSLIPLPGVNRIQYSLMEAGTTGWSIFYNPSSLTTNVANGTNITPYIAFGASYTTVGQSVGLESSNFYVTPGETLYVGGGGACGLSTLTITVYFFDSSGTVTGGNLITTLAAASGVWTPFGAFVTVPSGSVTGHIQLQAISTATGVQDCYITQPMVCGASAGQTVAPGFNPGPNAANAADVTSSNIAAGIAGQGTGATTNVGSLATLSSVATTNINANAVTNTTSAYTAGTLTITGGATVQTVGVTASGGVLEIDATAFFTVTNPSNYGTNFTVSITRNGTTIYSVGAPGYGVFPISFLDSPGAGSYTYNFIVTPGAGVAAVAFNRYLTVREYQR